MDLITARCELPDYKWTERQGYSDEEIAMFEELLHSNDSFAIPVCGEWGDSNCLNCLWYVDIRYIFGLMKMENQFMFIYQKVSLLQMRLKYGLQSQVDAFWQVMEVKFPRKS